MSTGIGHGVALPHARLDVPQMRLALARYSRGVDFGALDGQPVYIAFGLVSPTSEAGEHVRLRARIARFVRDPAALLALSRAQNLDEVLALFRSRDG